MRRYCINRGLPFTTSYTTRLPEYISARAPIPERWIYALLRSMVGETRGLGETLGSLNSITGVELALAWFFPHNHVSMLNRFWTGTALTPVNPRVEVLTA